MRLNLLLPACLLLAVVAAPPARTAPLDAEIRLHRGRPTVFIDGAPEPLPIVNPMNLEQPIFRKTVTPWFERGTAAYIIAISRARDQRGWATSRFWVGDDVSSEPVGDAIHGVDEQAAYILEHDSDAYLVVRFGTSEPQSWRDLHPDELFVSEDGDRHPAPSLASVLYNEKAAAFTEAVIRYCEGRPWADRIVGYANFTRMEGTHAPLVQHLLYDHSPVMQQRWRDYLRGRYGTDEALRKAHGDPSLSLDAAPVPRDKLRGPLPEVAQIPYWQAPADNQPLRDYLLLSAELFHARFNGLKEAAARATERKRFYLYDSLKLTMLGWSNGGFFNTRYSWPPVFVSDRAGSGHLGVAALMDGAGFNGLITPHDYQARGVGGIYEPEGSVDSAVLRGHYFLSEMDTRTYHQANNRRYGSARDLRAFAAVTWRNFATGWTRGFNSYWFDLYTDWFGAEGMDAIARRQIACTRQSVDWDHATVPGIAMVLDDSAALETNGSGHYFNEAILWEQKMGLARCGVPYRIYLLEDLALDTFPEHRVFYFPNLFRVDEDRLDLLRRKVFRDGRVVVWGPGSGIVDGGRLGPAGAERLTGFAFEPMLAVNHPRRVLISDFEHPVTRELTADTVYGGSAAYGPLLHPADGVELGRAWTKQGLNVSGLSIKRFGKGAAHDVAAGDEPGEGDWASVFTTAVPLPAGLWRGLARYAGAHVYSDAGDILLADATLVAVHGLRSGARELHLPAAHTVYDVVSGDCVAENADRLVFELDGPETRIFRLE